MKGKEITEADRIRRRITISGVLAGLASMAAAAELAIYTNNLKI
mgnify:CR=1 FL=1